MSRALQSIVAGYVKVKNRRALEGLLAHRRGMLAQLQAVTAINASASVQTVGDEISIIEAGLEELKLPPGSLPENEWG
ncbi:hypothetical protein IQ16_01757 [Bradyrhizobium huanghuaihaiense]|uniref:Uncharacterized protein n=1 Tax=Bradyrhizobium huanghuaihaiense TaxID=990078 RepID=A0A562RWZ6_9BRAD|nr:hypothetical protein [Bradyrhizobium huanghuaihaiense]TWI73619.1 hypothetical protein IQ16_01757 [Bradyrhizobium huanghuaihaiense]